jgi:hypothetical protein
LNEKSLGKWSETQDSVEWDDFVLQNGGSIFQTWAWREALGEKDSQGNPIRPFYLVYRDSGERILAACPFFYTQGRQGRYISETILESLPDWTFIAGPVISDSVANDAPRIVMALQKSVKPSSPTNPIVAMKFRIHQQSLIQLMLSLGLHHRQYDGLFVLDLHEKPPDHIWNNGFQRHDRRAIETLGKSAEFGFIDDDASLLNFSLLKRGAAIHRYDRLDFLVKTRAVMRDKLRIASVTLENEMIAGNMILCDTVISMVQFGMLRYSCTKNIHEPMANTTYINWKLINWAYENGFRYVNFGPYPVDQVSNPAHPSHQLQERFELAFVPRYNFTLPIPSLALSILKKIRQIKL